ncbi:MAG: queuosine precursor transporter [Candidatus Peribacteraceae bacterium]|jgi:hypothetical protein
MNLLLFILTLLTTLSLALLSFRLGKSIFFAYIGAIGTLTFFLAPMVVNMFGFPFAMMEIFYATIFLSTDMVAEHQGSKEARMIIWVAVVVGLTIGLVTQLAILFIPHSSDFVQPHIKALLAISPRILIASFIMFIVEQHFDIWFFHKLKMITGGKRLWLRNNLSTMTSQLIDVLGFYPLAFYGVYENIFQLMIAAYVFKVCMALIDTPFMYLSHIIKKSDV